MKVFDKVDKPVFAIAAVVYLCLFLFILIAPDTAASVIDGLVGVTLDSFGFVYLLVYAFILIAFLAIGFSSYGKMRLGKQDDRPEFSFPSWMGMLFGAGLGVGLVFYGVSEPMSHFMVAPFAESGTAEAASDAMRISFFHWSFLPWCLYGMAGLCIGYFLHRKGLPGLISSSFKPMLGDRIDKVPGKAINALSLVAVVCGVSMSLGFAATQLVSGICHQYGIENDFPVVCAAVVLIGVLSTISAVRGVEKGIKHISNLNLCLVVFFLLFALVCGSTSHLIKTFFEGLGDLLWNLPWMVLFMDGTGAVEAKVGFDWVGDWTIMYWAWWIAFAPFVGGFLARISKGRTIREFVIACTLVPALLCCLWFAFFGGEAIAMDLFQGAGIGESITANLDNSLFVFLEHLPASGVTIPLALLLIVTLIVTSVNSATYVAGQFSEGGSTAPSLGMRAFWGIFIAMNTLLFIYIGGLPALRGAAIVLAFPFALIMVLMVGNLVKDLRESNRESRTSTDPP